MGIASRWPKSLKDDATSKIEAIIPRKTILELLRLPPDTDDAVRVQMAANQ